MKKNKESWNDKLERAVSIIRILIWYAIGGIVGVGIGIKIVPILTTIF